MYARRRIRSLSFGLIALAVLAVALIAPASAFAEGTFISAPDRHDIVYDDARHVLYISAGDRVLRYDVVAGEFGAPWVLGGDLKGMDLSPDGGTLAVADGAYAGGQNWIHLVDVPSGASDTVEFGLTLGETGTWQVAFGADGRLLVTSSFDGSGWVPLRRYDPGAGLTDTLASVRQNTGLCASGDRQIIGFAEANASDGPWGRYRVSDGDLVKRTGYTDGTSAFNWDIAVSSDGIRYAIPTYNALKVYDAAFASVASVGRPLAAAYSRSGDTLYVIMQDTTTLQLLSAVDHSVLGTYDLETDFTWVDYYPGWGNAARIATSSDDAIVAVTVTGGVRFVRRSPVVEGVARSSYAGLPVAGASVELWREEGGAWSVEATVPAGPQGSWSYSTDDTSPVRVHVTDPSGSHTAAWHGGTDLATAIDVTPAVEGGPQADVVMTLTNGGSVAGAVRSAVDGRPVAGVHVDLASAYGSPGDPPLASTVTAADGTYGFDALPSWTYVCSYVDPGGDYADAQSSSGIVVTAPAETTADQVMQFVPVSVQGDVTSSYRGLPVPNAEVELWRDGAGGWSKVEETVADDSGHWTCSTNATEPVRVFVSDPSDMHDDAWYGASGSPASVVPGRGTVPEADVEMPLTSPGGVCGYVSDGFSPRPVPGAQLTLYCATDGNAQVGTTTAASDGSFHFHGLGPGTYHLYITDPSGKFLPQYYSFSDTLAEADEIVIDSPGESFGFVFLERNPPEYQVRLSPTAFAPATPDVLQLGVPVTLETTVTDVLTGGPVSGLQLTVHISPNAADWYYAEGSGFLISAPVSLGGGRYATTVTMFAEDLPYMPIYFRFACDEYVDIDYADSAPVLCNWRQAANGYPQTVHRFYNRRAGVHFYTASEAERQTVENTLAHTFNYEGPAYSPNLANRYNDVWLYRFYNRKTGTHFYTASESEKNNVLATLSHTYTLEGVAYRVSQSARPSTFPVYRFYNRKTGTHFYTSSVVERDTVIATLGHTYNFEGIAFYVGR